MRARLRRRYLLVSVFGAILLALWSFVSRLSILQPCHGKCVVSSKSSTNVGTRRARGRGRGATASSPVRSTFYVNAAVTTWHNARPAAVSITFDDGRWSAIEVGAKLLEKHGLRGTFFVVTSRLERRSPSYRRTLRRLAEGGHELGSHTVSHAKLSVGHQRRPKLMIHPDAGRHLIANWTDEIEQSAEHLRRTLRGWGLNAAAQRLTFAYPYGRGSSFDELKNGLKRIYAAARGLENDINYSRPNDLFALRTLSWVTRTSPAVMAVWTERAVLHGSSPTERGFTLSRSWLVLTGHGIRPAASGSSNIEEGYEPAPERKFEEYLYALEKMVEDGLIWANTFGAVVDYIRSRDAVQNVETVSSTLEEWCLSSHMSKLSAGGHSHQNKPKPFCNSWQMASVNPKLIVRLRLTVSKRKRLPTFTFCGVTLAITVRFQPLRWTNKEAWRCTASGETVPCNCPIPKHQHQMLWRSTGQLVCILANVKEDDDIVILLERL